MQAYFFEFKNLTKLGGPAVLAQLSQMALGVIDTLMAGRIDSTALAAIAIGTNIINPLIVFLIGLFLALNPMVAQANGSKQTAQIGSLFQHSLIVAIILAIPSMYLINNTLPFMQLLDIQESLLPIVNEYLVACSYGLIPLFIFLALRFCNEGLFATPAIMVVSLSAIPFNIVFNYWFIWGGFGLDPMGVVGVGYATACVWTLMAIGLLVFTKFKKSYRSYSILTHWHPFDLKVLKELFAIGLPMSIAVSMEVAMFAMIGLFIGRYAIEIVAAHQVALNIASLAYMVPLGLSMAISARVGFYAGKNKLNRLALVGKVGIGTSITLSVFSACIMIIAPTFLLSAYTQDQQVIFAAMPLLTLAAFFQISDAAQASISGALRGIKDTQVPMAVSLFAYWCVGFPIGYYMAEFEGWQAKGYWVGIVFGLTVAAILLAFRWFNKVRKLGYTR